MSDLPLFEADLDAGWRFDAACWGMEVNIFFVEKGPNAKQKNEEAKKVCRKCLVRFDCLESALREPQPWFGIRGGLTPKERRRVRWNDFTRSPASAVDAVDGRLTPGRPRKAH